MAMLAYLYAQVDAGALLTVAAIVATVGMLRRRRPFTRSRALDVGLSSLLFVLLGVRYAILAVLAVLTPKEALPGADITTVVLLASLFGAASVVGFITHRGSVPSRVFGASTLLMVSLVEAAASAFLLDAPLAMDADTALSVVIAAAGLVAAAFFWTHRTATPNPLGSGNSRFDY
ncbi:hypothetical protein RDV64_13615 [Acuticoccus sp. MNP-M23]|uniref:hypothetical protein n=1 Tax=Acuticoccus sp. MNP-M23 TaxID=3072793 RepID=UPI00281698C8|nr:hypothetical protein [Acuticoccus sp. MNP-M23]WMS41119.1 hypothetical protein RDV64_13615 [Acuticoccus sp. MNP-M23]